MVRDGGIVEHNARLADPSPDAPLAARGAPVRVAGETLEAAVETNVARRFRVLLARTRPGEPAATTQERVARSAHELEAIAADNGRRLVDEVLALVRARTRRRAVGR